MIPRAPLLALLTLALGPAASGCGPRGTPSTAEVAAVPDSTWFRIAGPTIIAFHPRVTNEQIDADEGLATVLDDLGVAVQYQAGDTIKLLTPRQVIWVRPADSVNVGFLFVDARGHQAELYGVRTNIDLVAFAREFARTGRLTAR